MFWVGRNQRCPTPQFLRLFYVPVIPDFGQNSVLPELPQHTQCLEIRSFPPLPLWFSICDSPNISNFWVRTGFSDSVGKCVCPNVEIRNHQSFLPTRFLPVLSRCASERLFFWVENGRVLHPTYTPTPCNMTRRIRARKTRCVRDLNDQPNQYLDFDLYCCASQTLTFVVLFCVYVNICHRRCAIPWTICRLYMGNGHGGTRTKTTRCRPSQQFKTRMYGLVYERECY